MKIKLLLIIASLISLLTACEYVDSRWPDYPQCKGVPDPSRCNYRAHQEVKRVEYLSRPEVQKMILESSPHILISYGETSNAFAEFSNLKKCHDAIEAAKKSKSKIKTECLPK